MKKCYALMRDEHSTEERVSGSWGECYMSERSRYKCALDEPALTRDLIQGVITEQSSRTVRDRLAPPAAKTWGIPMVQDLDTYIPTFDNDFWDNMTK